MVAWHSSSRSGSPGTAVSVLEAMGAKVTVGLFPPENLDVLSLSPAARDRLGWRTRRLPTRAAVHG